MRPRAPPSRRVGLFILWGMVSEVNVDESLVRLQLWYSRQCDGDWEHGLGIRIESLDNPGWSVRIDLKGTNLDGRDGLGRKVRTESVG